jgi:hypothetical protein
MRKRQWRRNSVAAVLELWERGKMRGGVTVRAGVVISLL